MDRLWTPWRYRYVTTGEHKTECVFCTIGLDSEHDEDNLVVFRGALTYVVLNLYPYTSGHLMVVPYRHTDSLDEAGGATSLEIMSWTRAAERHLRAVYGAPGVNLGMNIGACAGAGVAGHIHMHVLPRWPGDANFMTTIGETRVMPEDLKESWRRLRAVFRASDIPG